MTNIFKMRYFFLPYMWMEIHIAYHNWMLNHLLQLLNMPCILLSKIELNNLWCKGRDKNKNIINLVTNQVPSLVLTGKSGFCLPYGGSHFWYPPAFSLICVMVFALNQKFQIPKWLNIRFSFHITFNVVENFWIRNRRRNSSCDNTAENEKSWLHFECWYSFCFWCLKLDNLL